MTQDEIIRMARDAGFFEFNIEGWINEFERFTALVAAHEREKQAEQKPVAWRYHNGEAWIFKERKVFDEAEPLYAAPQPVQSLTAQDLNDLEIETKWAGDSHEFERIVNAAAAKLKPVRTKDLTDDEIWAEGSFLGLSENAIFAFARAVIAAYKEKNK